MLSLLLIQVLVYGMSCESSTDHPLANQNEEELLEETSFFYGADLSYVNEMEDCGAIYCTEEGEATDVYSIFQTEGCNLARYRLWHSPDWTNYSNLNDVKKSIKRAKEAGMTVLLDFHYSDTWADPEDQEIPAAWVSELNNTLALGKLLYDYTYQVLTELQEENLTPNIVQVGNETNGSILVQGDPFPIDWERNSALFNRGIGAVRDFSAANNTNIEVMLHIAQPENGLWWFEEALKNGITDYDWIGISYYPQFSDYSLENVDIPLEELISTYNKKLMVVETAYPYSLTNQDNANNVLGEKALVSGIPASQQGQLSFMVTLESKVKSAGGSGIVYWEPAWVSTNCSTRWGQGSHWDNATFFDSEGKPTLGMKFYNATL